ncbi:putative pilus system protein FilC [Acinetobacter gyllenbergii]|uniref:putative pilus system protein FilC n=1 Tax=Acinetobacter gyllenbergii TaxID=134534 RepID=UPI000806DBAB|nr:transporter [Acinetobacter gyllenbergii]OBY73762.1 signal peptide protein [Acinetobacter gyllenbergii]
MNRTWMNMSVLALSLSAITSTLYAAEQQPPVESGTETAPVEVQGNATTESPATPGPEPQAPAENNQADQAASALQKKESDATQETNLQEVFTSNERQYSLIKKGIFSSYYDLDYTYYRDSRLDLAMSDSNSSLSRLRVEEDANHTLTNTFTVQYGLLDNVTLSASLPFVAKKELLKDQTTAGLGDINFGARWEPFPLKQGRLPLVLFGSLSTKTGDSPYEVGVDELSTGKGYYSVGAGASTRKYIDPVVLFASVSTSYGFKESGLNQLRGSRVLESFDPGLSGGFSFGFAYSFNYDVSLTMSYQQSFNTGAKFYFENNESYESADQSSAMLSFALGVRVSPETIVNGTVGIGLTEDAPDVSLGLSFPLDIIGFGKKIR